MATARTSLQDWLRQFKEQKNPVLRAVEQLRYEIADAIKWKAREIANKNFGNREGPGPARTRGRSGELQRSIEVEALADGRLAVVAGGPGVPYARVHELGTVGAGGELPNIVPKNAGALTIPLSPEYVGHRAREFDLQLIEGGQDDTHNPIVFLINRVTGEAAYILLKSVAIPPRPYLAPAVAAVARDEVLQKKLAELTGKNTFGTGTLGTWEVRRI